MYTRISHIHIAMPLLHDILNQLSFYLPFAVDKKPILDILSANIFSVVKIRRVLHLVKVVLDAYSMVTFFCRVVGWLPDCPTTINHLFTNRGTITKIPPHKILLYTSLIPRNTGFGVATGE